MQLLDTETIAEGGAVHATVPTAATILTDARRATGLTGWDLADYLSELVAETVHASAQALREAKAAHKEVA